jgi:hypothetical protein
LCQGVSSALAYSPKLNNVPVLDKHHLTRIKFGWSRLEHDIIKQLIFLASNLDALKKLFFAIHKIKASKGVVICKPPWRHSIGNF